MVLVVGYSFKRNVHQPTHFGERAKKTCSREGKRKSLKSCLLGTLMTGLSKYETKSFRKKYRFLFGKDDDCFIGLRSLGQSIFWAFYYKKCSNSSSSNPSIASVFFSNSTLAVQNWTNVQTEE